MVVGSANAGGSKGAYWDGYLAETVWIDGTALDPTSFGEFDEDSGIWKPIDVSGLTAGTNGFYLDFEASGNLQEFIGFNSTDSFRWYHRTSGGTAYYLNTNRLFRDVSAYYNILVVYDSSQGTASNRVKFFVNGTQETSFETSNYPAQDVDSELNKANAVRLYSWFGSEYFNGYIAENVFCDGQALDPTSFGEFDSDSGIWKPIDVSGLTFGNNGFYLDFEDSSALGNDAAGSNNFTVNNLTAVDQSISTPTNIFATFNSAQPALANTSFSEGNLVATTNSSASTQVPFATTIPVSTGKWYAEFKMIAKSTSSGSIPYIGVLGAANFVSKLDNAYFVGGANLDGVGYGASGVVYSNSSELDSSEASFDDGDIISVAADITNRKIYFAKNGTYINSGNPAAAANGYTIPTTSESFYIFSASLFGASGSWGANFGSPPYSESGGETDGNGYGNFAHAVPANYYSLNTKNLAEYG
jgi:hypothetical protein